MLAIGTWEASLFLLLGVVLFFIIAILNRQLNNIGVSFNGIYGFIAALAPYLIIGWLWRVKWALIAGLVLGIVAGIIGGQTSGGDDG